MNRGAKRAAAVHAGNRFGNSKRIENPIPAKKSPCKSIRTPPLAPCRPVLHHPVRRLKLSGSSSASADGPPRVCERLLCVPQLPFTKSACPMILGCAFKPYSHTLLADDSLASTTWTCVLSRDMQAVLQKRQVNNATRGGGGEKMDGALIYSRSRLRNAGSNFPTQHRVRPT